MARVDVLVAGGGVSGMIAAITAAQAGDRVVILEKLNQPGKKLLATGSGRCNLMNRGSLRYRGDEAFARAVMGPDPVTALTLFWRRLGIVLRYDAEGRGYPCTYAATTVLDALKLELKRRSVSVLTGCRIQDVQRDGTHFLVKTESGERFLSDRVILAMGGAAQPALGGGLDAWPWLEKMGHRLIPATPALTSLETDPRSVSGLSGIRVKCRLTVLTDGAPVYRESGELLFTDYGISGICVMQCSRYVQEDGRSEGSIDLFPDLFPDTESLFAELAQRQRNRGEDSPTELLQGLCVPKLAYAVCKQAGFPLRGERARELTENDLHRLAGKMKDYRVRILRREGFRKAQVMAGGVDCSEVSPETLSSRLCPGLHITGELLNVDGDCGGYNLMFASMTGIRAGENGRMSFSDQG